MDQEFLSHRWFRPGVARIPLGILQELRARPYVGRYAIPRWALSFMSLSVYCAHIAVARFPGGERALKQTYFDFRDSMETCRVNMSDPDRWARNYRSSPLQILSLQERASFPSEMSRIAWRESGATLKVFAAVDHAGRLFEIFPDDEYWGCFPL